MEENHTAEAGSGMRGSSGSTPSAGSRWNPTKEQISMLENLFKQGIRNPNAEQIQHITSSLRAYGHIEGKNVFYWFQNHKARQRQKQKQIKQQRIPHFNRYNIHACTSQPIFSPPLCQNDICVPHCLQVQQNGMRFLYPQQQKVLAAKQVVSFGMPRICDGPQICSQFQQNYNNFGNSNQWQLETLALFPLHPTGILEGKATHQAPSISVDTSSTSHDIDVEDHCPPNKTQPLSLFLPLATRVSRE